MPDPNCSFRDAKQTREFPLHRKSTVCQSTFLREAFSWSPDWKNCPTPVELRLCFYFRYYYEWAHCTMNDWLEFDYGMVAGWKGLPSCILHVGIPGKRSLILDLDLANFNMRRKNTRLQRVYNQISCVSFQAARGAFPVLFLVAIISQSQGLFLQADGKIVHINNGTLI